MKFLKFCMLIGFISTYSGYLLEASWINNMPPYYTKEDHGKIVIVHAKENKEALRVEKDVIQIALSISGQAESNDQVLVSFGSMRMRFCSLSDIKKAQELYANYLLVRDILQV